MSLSTVNRRKFRLADSREVRCRVSREIVCRADRQPLLAGRLDALGNEDRFELPVPDTLPLPRTTSGSSLATCIPRTCLTWRVVASDSI